MTNHQKRLSKKELQEQIYKALCDLRQGFVNSAICHLEYASQ